MNEHVIKSICRSLEKKFPRKFIYVTHDFGYHKSGWRSDERTLAQSWSLYVEDILNEDYATFDEMVESINNLLEIDTKILIVRE